MKFTAVAATILMVGSAAAAPVYETQGADSGPITGDMITQLCKQSAAACGGIAAPACTDPSDKECTKPADAAKFLNMGFKKYKIQAKGQVAAVWSLSMFESGAYKYRRSANGGNPGKGTSNLQSSENNAEYAKSLPGIKDKAAPFYADTVAGKNPGADQTLNLLTSDDEVNFGSGMWYFAASGKVPENVQKALADNPTVESYNQFLTQGVHTTSTDARVQGFNAAMSLLQ